MGEKELIPITSASGILDVNVATLRRWIKSGELKAYTKPGRGRTLFVERAAVEKRLEFVPFVVGSSESKRK